MKNQSVKYFIPLILLCLSACNFQNKETEEPGPALFPQPKSFPVNTDGGYIVNTLTGDTIQPLINSLGDTIKTGVAIPTQGKFINPDSVSKPKIVKAGTNPKTVNAHPNVHIIPDNLTIIPVDESKLKRHNSSNTDSPLLWRGAGGEVGGYILNSTGDTIPTGIPIPTKGKAVPCIYPKSTQALPLRVKDNAICDFQYLDVDQGMASSYVVSMLEDKSGNLWFGTSGGGVSKYDGKSFTHFTENEGLSNNVVWSILEDKSGNLWFGTYGGASMYDGKSFTHFTENEGLSNNGVLSILEDKSGNLWFGTYGGGISKYDGKSFTHFTENEGLSHNVVLSILEDKSGNLWFGTFGGVSKFDGKSFIHFTENDGLSNNYVWSILEDQSGNLWFGTGGGGVSKFDGKSFVHFTENEGLSNNVVRSILEDQSGNLWFGTGGSGVSKYDGKSFVHFTENEGLSNNVVLSTLEDKSGNLWFGTHAGGVSKYDVKSFVHFTENEGLSNNYIRSILEDKSGNFWFCTYGGGVSKYDGKSFVHFTENEGLSNNYVWSILEDKSRNLWFGTDGGGVSKYDGKSFTHFTENEGLSNNYVRSILEDKSGNLWFGTNGGASMYDGKSFTHFTENEGLSNNYVWSILEDQSGNLWFGTYRGGVCKFDGKSFVHFTENEGLSNNYVRSILEDQSGNLWFGTYGGGVSKYDGKSFVHFTENEGLSNNVVLSILEGHPDGDQECPQPCIWVSTGKGLSLIKMNGTRPSNKQGQESAYAEASADKNKNYSIITLNKQNGLKGLEFFQNSVFLDSKNRIWWGGIKGLEMLDLNKFKTSNKIPAAFLKALDINETFVDYRNLTDSAKQAPLNEVGQEIEFNGVAPFENYPLNLELPYNRNHLTFHFAAIDWAAPHKIKYQYKLEGFDEKWSPVTDKTEADYRNIPYGIFTFKVRAIGESQIWGEPFEYTFTIHPPWWHTWWFRVLMAALFILILFLLYRSRTAALRARQKQLEKTVEERTAEAVSEKNEAQKQKVIAEKQTLIAEEQKELIAEKHKEITDSINYAERIQRSFLATKGLLDENLNSPSLTPTLSKGEGEGLGGFGDSGYFVLFQPKDVVSGDFYWATKLHNGNFALVTADSTGHGVPGAIMSILNINCLEKAVEEEKLVDPAEILNHARLNIIDRLKKDGSPEGGKDGMDCSLVCFDLANKKLIYAAANNPVWIVRQNSPSPLEKGPGDEAGGPTILEFAPDKMPVGKHDRQHVPFTSKQVELEKGDVVYTLTDGMPDQFGGEKGKKFMYKKLKELLIEISVEPMEIQKEKLRKAFFDWKGDLEQVDDVCIIGVRI